MRISRNIVAALGALILLSSGCEMFTVSGTRSTMQIDPADVQGSARAAYLEGMEDLVGGNYLQAMRQFGEVARSPRYVHYAALATLRIGDALFLQDRYEEAIQAYAGFIKQYSSDPNIPYAQFRIASAYYERLPSDWFLTVPDHEIDQTMAKETMRVLTGFLNRFPASRFAPEAREMLAEASGMLFDHELYVADFYEGRDRHRAVAWRLEAANTRFPELGRTEPIFWRTATSYESAGEKADAARWFGKYIDAFPDAEHAKDARVRLDVLQAELTPNG